MDAKDIALNANPITGPAAWLGAFDNPDDFSGEYQAANAEINEASKHIDEGYTKLIGDFESALLGYRTTTKGRKLDLSKSVVSDMETRTNAVLAQAGPLNEASTAKLRLQLMMPIARNMLEYKLGTFDQDLSMAMGGVMGSLQLQREKVELWNAGMTTKLNNSRAYEAYKRGQPSKLERMLGNLSSGLRGAAAGAMLGGPIGAVAGGGLGITSSRMSY